MRKIFEFTKSGAESLLRRLAAVRKKPEAQSPAAESSESQPVPIPKPPPEPPLFFMLSHLDDDGPVRLDGVKLGVCEVMGLEIDEPKLGAFAGALNALDFPAQLLIRQHPPRLGHLREKLKQAQPDSLPPKTRAASESLQRLLTDLETRDGILDRRFYAACEFARVDELRACFPGPGSPSTSSEGGSFGCSSCPPPWAAHRPSSTRRPPSRWRSVGATFASAGASCAPSTWASGPGRWHPASSRGSWPPERRWTCPSTSARYRRSRRRGRWSGRRCASSRRSPSHTRGAAPCPPRRRSPWRT